MACLPPFVLAMVLFRVACDAAVSDAREETCLDSEANKHLVQARRSLNAVTDEKEDLAATEAVKREKCPWHMTEGKGCHQHSDQRPLCEDGNYSWSCSKGGHGERQQCPCEWPRMCNEKRCRGDYCCEPTCGDFGGPRLCEGEQEAEPTNEPTTPPEPIPEPTPQPTPRPTPQPPTLIDDWFDAESSVATDSNWGTAMRELMGFCQKKGYKAGVPTGNRANYDGKEVRGVWCLKGDALNWFDAPTNFHVENDWGPAFRYINNRCRDDIPGYATGIPNGHHADNLRGSYCFKQGPFLKWVDTPFSFSVNGNNDWSGALTKVGAWCQKEGWDWGFPNGHEAHGVRGAFCFKEG